MPGIIEDPAFRRARAQKASRARYRPADDPSVVEAAAELAELIATDYVKTLVAAQPRLSLEARHKLALILLTDEAAS